MPREYYPQKSVCNDLRLQGDNNNLNSYLKVEEINALQSQVYMSSASFDTLELCQTLTYISATLSVAILTRIVAGRQQAGIPSSSGNVLKHKSL